jgi:hypothetical protein
VLFDNVNFCSPSVRSTQLSCCRLYQPNESLRNTVCLTIIQVLDRLNALFEPGGELVISERGLDSNGLFLLLCQCLTPSPVAPSVLIVCLGQICTIRPHPNFRAFMAMNSVSGEVSQPMRNRGIEISILSSDFTRSDAVRFVSNVYVCASFIYSSFRLGSSRSGHGCEPP